MVKNIRLFFSIILLGVLFACVPRGSAAESNLGFSVEVSSEKVQTGEEVQVVISLEGYGAQSEGIRGLQVDVEDVNPDILTVQSYSTLIQDDTALSNKASYNRTKQFVRLVYLHMSEQLPAPCSQVMKIVFQVNDDLTVGGEITLPVVVKIQTWTQQITLTGNCTIRYGTEAVVSVDITWGDMDFVYNKGTWDPNAHQYFGGGWSDNGTGYVRVTNTGETDALVTFSYTPKLKEIEGSFQDEEGQINAPVRLLQSQTKTIQLKLSGIPTESIEKEIIGSVTINIGGE